MPGNTALRRELDEANKIRIPAIYHETIERLRHQFSHSISILSDGKGRIERFNCFAYGLGVWEHLGFIKMVDDASNSAIISSQIVQAMIEDDALKTVTTAEAQIGDVAVYFNTKNVTHAAVVGEDGVFRSKWGGNEDISEWKAYRIRLTLANDFAERQIRLFVALRHQLTSWALIKIAGFVLHSFDSKLSPFYSSIDTTY